MLTDIPRLIKMLTAIKALLVGDKNVIEYILIPAKSQSPQNFEALLRDFKFECGRTNAFTEFYHGCNDFCEAVDGLNVENIRKSEEVHVRNTVAVLNYRDVMQHAVCSWPH